MVPSGRSRVRGAFGRSAPVIRSHLDGTGPAGWHPRGVITALASMTRLWPEQWTGSSLFERRLHEAALFARGLRGIGEIPTTTLLLGDQGNAVGELQRRLGNLRIDNDFGPRTLRAVFKHQESSGRGTPDGIWGPA